MAQTILIDASPLGGNVSGAGRYAYELLDALLPLTDGDSNLRFEIVLPPTDRMDWDVGHWDRQTNVAFRRADIRGIGPARQWWFLRQVLTGTLEYDLFHALSSYLPVAIRGSSVVTIHDLKHVRVPSYFRGLGRFKHQYVANMIRWSARTADHVITVSEHTQSDLGTEFGVNEANVTVIPQGPGGADTTTDEPPQVPNPYLLFVGSLRPHKNLDTLVDAYNEYRERTEGTVPRLVIAGSEYGDATDDLRERAGRSLQGGVDFLGRVTDEELARLYAHAATFVYPSLYEGFGLPPLEAMGHGTPVIASDRTSVPEVVGDAGVLVDPTDAGTLADAIERVLSDEALRERLCERGHERFMQFSWERTARETLTVYETLLSNEQES